MKIGKRLLKGLTASATMAGVNALMVYPSRSQLPLLPPPPPAIPSPSLPVPELTPQSSVLEVYTLGAGDRIQIDVFNVPEYSGPNGQHQVLADGSLSLPLIGSLSVQGMTLEQASEAIKEKYAKYLRRPLITLKLLAPRPLQIAVAGEVHRPGAYTVSPSAGPGGMPEQLGMQLPTVTKVIQMAGGITPSADVRQVKIRRSQRNGPQQIINVDLWELLQNGNLRADMSLRDGDIIFVPTVTDINREETRTLADANFAGQNTQAINIAIVGAVSRPGTYTLAREMQISASVANSELGNPANLLGGSEAVTSELSGSNTVTKAIRMAGGITPKADLRKIEVRRITRAGTQQTITVDLWQLLQTGDVAQDIVLQEGDTVMVPEASSVDSAEVAAVATSSFSPDTIRISIVGEVLKPGALAVPPNTPLAQAILAAGGFNKARAQMDEVELVRLNANGTVSRRIVKINLAVEANEETNPPLQNQDVVMVRRSGRAAFSDRVGGTLAPLSPLLGIFRFFDLFR